MNGTGAAAGPEAREPDRPMRQDLALIADMIAPGSRVLDIGCGDGALLDHLVHAKGVDGRGMELSQAGVNACVAHGLSVVQGDADTDLAQYPDRAFDYAVLSHTLQVTRNPKTVVSHLVRIGTHAVVSFTNFGHWRFRLDLLMQGRMPAVSASGDNWYDTANIRLCTIRDFAEMCGELELTVNRAVSLSRSGLTRELNGIGASANLRSEEAIFLLTRR